MEVLNYKEFKVTDEMLASQRNRFVNLIIDRLAYYLIIMFVGVIIYVIAELLGFDKVIFWMENITKAMDYLITFSVMFVYYLTMESLIGKTVGKATTRTMVVLENGEKPSSKEIALRTVSRFVPFDIFSFLGTPSRGWHDSWSNTYVVKEAILKPEFYVSFNSQKSNKM